MPTRVRLTVAMAAAATLVALPAYATVIEGRASSPAATPTRIVATSTTPPGPTGGAGGSATGSDAPKTTYRAPAASAEVTPPQITDIKPDNRFASDTGGPDARTVFTQGELAQVIPGLSEVEAQDCRPGEAIGGERTTNARCVLTLTIKGEPEAVRSRLVVNVRGFGDPNQVGRSWETGLAADQQRASETPGRYAFYKASTLGASGAYTDGTTTRTLVQRPGAAAEIWFSGIGFTTLKSDYSASRKDFRDRVSPALVQLLATKIKPAKG